MSWQALSRVPVYGTGINPSLNPPMRMHFFVVASSPLSVLGDDSNATRFRLYWNRLPSSVPYGDTGGISLFAIDDEAGAAVMNNRTALRKICISKCRDFFPSTADAVAKTTTTFNKTPKCTNENDEANWIFELFGLRDLVYSISLH